MIATPFFDKSLIRFALVLGILSAVGPLAIDMYLPAMAAIDRDMKTDQAHVEMTIMSFFLGLTVGQPIYGPVSDRLGRRIPLVIGISIYVIASGLCVLAPSINFLIVSRALQGFGAGAGLTIGGAIVRDIHFGDKAVRLLAARTLVIGVSPLIAPVLGAIMIAGGSWRNIFVSQVAFGVFALGTILLIPETLEFDRRASEPIHRVFGSYAKLLRNRSYIAIVLSASFVQAALVAYIAGSPLVLLTIGQVSPLQYSAIFAGNGLVFILAAQVSPSLIGWRGSLSSIRLVLLVQSAVCLLIALAALAHLASLPVLIPLLLLFHACAGAVGAPAVVLALAEHGSIAGTASGFMVFFQLAFGAGSSALVAGFSDGTAIPMALTMTVASLGAFATALLAPTVAGHRTFRRSTPDN